MRVHQAVLGYDRGHRLIGSSTDLNSLSKHLLLQLSDRAVEVQEIPKCGYLTGYPLAEDGLYVLARTWAAPEMPRPGCIWTHSLFVSFTKLAQLEDPRSLLPAFRRPSLSEDAGTYTLPIRLEIPSRTSWTPGGSKSGCGASRTVVFGIRAKGIRFSTWPRVNR